MNLVEHNGSPHPLYKSIRFDDFDVTWAGANPFRPGFCFGSDDGRLRFTDEEGNNAKTIALSVSGEAINGIAGANNWWIGSSRGDVTLFWLETGEPNKLARMTIPTGAHGVVATPGGYAVAPLGRAGVLHFKPEFGTEQKIEIAHNEEKPIQFYKVAALRDPKGNDILAFAARQDGVAIMPFPERVGTGNLFAAQFGSLDVVDVCALGAGSAETPFAAIGRDGTLILFRDAQTDKNPFIIKWDAIEGAVYRVLSSRGHVFILTSKALYMLVNLGSRWRRNDPIQGGTTLILTIPVDAVDANVCGDKYLLVVTADKVLRFDIDLMEQYKPHDSNGEFQDLVPTVLKLNREWLGLPQETRSLAGVA